MNSETDRHDRLYRMADLTKEENGIKNRMRTPAEWPQERFCPPKGHLRMAFLGNKNAAVSVDTAAAFIRYKSQSACSASAA